MGVTKNWGGGESGCAGNFIDKQKKRSVRKGGWEKRVILRLKKAPYIKGEGGE